MNRIVILFTLLYLPLISAAEFKHELGITQIENSPERVIALNWGFTETLIALDIKPIAIADIDGYNTWVKYPALPQGIQDVGIRREPNLEAIKALKPDLILISKELAPAYEQLSAIAPTIAISVFTDKKNPLEAAKSMARLLGDIFDKPQSAEALIQQTNQVIADSAASIAAQQEDLLFIRFLSERTVRVHSQGSLLHDTISQMGLKNSWQEKTNMWGFTKAGVSKLAQHQKSRVMVIGPLSESEQQRLKNAKLWQLMAFSKENRVHILPAIWTYGGLIAAQRFSQQVAKSLNQSVGVSQVK